jgi:hypothetical protein
MSGFIGVVKVVLIKHWVETLVFAGDNIVDYVLL